MHVRKLLYNSLIRSQLEYSSIPIYISENFNLIKQTQNEHCKIILNKKNLYKRILNKQCKLTKIKKRTKNTIKNWKTKLENHHPVKKIP